MKNIASSILLIAVLLFSSLVNADAPPLREKYAVDWFVESCLKHAGNIAKLADWAPSRKLTPLTNDVAKVFLLGSPGRGWSASNHSGKYAIVMREDGLCTVFTRRAKPQSTRKYFFEVLNRLLPESKVDRTEYTKKKRLKKGFLETTHFFFSKEGSKKVLDIVISTSSSIEGNYQVAMSTKLCIQTPNKKLLPTGCTDN